MCLLFFFFSSRRRHTRSLCDWSSDVCSSDLVPGGVPQPARRPVPVGGGRRCRARCDDRRRVRAVGRARADRPRRGVRRGAPRRRPGLRAGALDPRRPLEHEPRPGRRRRRLVPDRGAVVPAAAAFGDAPPGLHVDPRAARDDRMGRRASGAAVGRPCARDDVGGAPAARRDRGGRRRGTEPRPARGPAATGRGGRRLARDRGRGRGRRADRVRRADHPAHGPADGRRQLPIRAAALGAVRRVVPHPRGHPRSDRGGTGRDPDRRHHGVHRGTILHRGAPTEPEGGVKLDERAGVVTALEVRDLSVELGRRRILSEVRMDVPEGGWVCVIGPNGAGKTTLLHAVAGLLPRSGSVRLWGRPIEELGRRERARTIALVPQLPVIPESFTVEQYALLGRTPHLGLLASERERLDLGWAATRRLDTLSGGELRRAVIARAIAQEASLLLLDETTTGLDIAQQLRVLELVEELRTADGLTVISTMHDLTLAGRFAHRFALLSEGRVVAEGARAEVLLPHVIAEHYGARVGVIDDGTLGWAVVPLSGPDR